MDSEEYSHGDVQDLHTQLFVTNSYNKKIRPLVDQDTVLNISIDFHLSAITQFDEQDESLSTAGYLHIKWTDEFLTWNPDDNNGINWIIIVLKSTCSVDITYFPFDAQKCSMVLKSTCSVDITYFPFDAQKCSMVFVVWSYTHIEIELLTQKGFGLAEYSGSSTWKIVSAVSEFNNNLYIPKATFTLNLQRKPLFYMLNMLRLLNREETNCPVGGCYRCLYKLVKCFRCKTCKPRPSKVSNLQSHDNGIDESSGEGNETVTWPDVIDAIDFLCFWPQDDIWKPDVSLHNSYSPFKGLGSSHLNAWILSTGFVQWEPFQVLKSTCSVDITYFPFDAQKCSMVFVVWSYTHVEIELLTQNGFVLAEYSGSSTWEIVSAVSEFNNNLYIPKATFNLNLQRKPLFYMLNMVIPIIFLSIMNIFTFTLPAKSGERASYAVTLFLSISVFLTIIAAEFPKNSDNLSYLALYLTIMTSISTIFVIITVLQLRLLNREETNCPVGGCYRCIYKLVKCLRCKTCKPRPSKVYNLQSHDNGIDESSGEGNEKITWPDVIDAIDFLCFWIGSVVTFTVTMTILLALLNNPDRD
ncbi:neuronal acetylcholine receptor subunit alpha-2-like [Ruditapes philippinarum]|uniref:neuronal acetylcholine receptor subunit alpha-2-like n=1 Tax=Ruditapes philippinarum TaxID=129788 RepID=UPI00295B65AA|nr:neuronal acetylcholine receptor subunit alpha-2-like [Ruditapes philippinarum]